MTVVKSIIFSLLISLATLIITIGISLLWWPLERELLDGNVVSLLCHLKYFTPFRSIYNITNTSVFLVVGLASTVCGIYWLKNRIQHKPISSKTKKIPIMGIVTVTLTVMIWTVISYISNCFIDI